MAYRNALRGGPSHGTGNVDKNLVKFGRVIFKLCERTEKQTERQTDKQADIRIIILSTPPGGEVISQS